MCGIVGYVGKRDVLPVLLGGLQKLEYRGYDSAGIAYIQDGGMHIVKAKGRLANLREKLGSAMAEDTIGITVILWEQRGTTWYEVARASSQLRNTDYADASGTKTVEGGHYYKVTGTHTSSKNGISYSVTSETSSRWIP